MVRTRWKNELDKNGHIFLSFTTGDEDFSDTVLSLADAYRINPQLEEHLPALDAAFNKFVESNASTRH